MSKYLSEQQKTLLIEDVKIKIKEKRFAESEELLLNFITVDKSYSDAYYCLSKIFLEHYKDTQYAIKMIDQAIDYSLKIQKFSNTDLAEYYFYKGLIYYNSKISITNNEYHQQENIIGNYLKAVELNPDHLEAHMSLGIVNYQIGNYDDAIYYFKQVRRINPSDALSHFYLYQLESNI